MARVLLTGADGFVGTAVFSHLVAAGHEVVRATRFGSEGSEATGDIGPTTDWTRALAGTDAVVHLAARVHRRGSSDRDRALFERTNVAGSERLAAQGAGLGVERLVFLSTVGIVGSAVAAPVDEGTAPDPANTYAASKLEAEQRLLEIGRASNLQVAVLRAPLVYGPGAPGSLARLRSLVENGAPLPFGSVDNRRSAVSVDNLAAAIVASLSSDIGGGWWYVEDGTVWSTRQMIEEVGKTIGRTPRLVSVPVASLRSILSLVGKRDLSNRLLGSLVVDGSAFRSATGWMPPSSVDAALSRGVV